MNTYIVHTLTGRHLVKADFHRISLFGHLHLIESSTNSPTAIFKQWNGFVIRAASPQDISTKPDALD